MKILKNKWKKLRKSLIKSNKNIKNWLIKHKLWSNRNKKTKMKWWNNMLIIYKMSKN